MRIESREMLAVGIFGGKSRIGDRIEVLLRRGRGFSPRASGGGLTASVLILGCFLLADSLTPRWIAFAQELPRPAFEVASIRQNTGASRLVHMQPSPGGRLTVENIPPGILLQQAFDVKEFQIVGGPAWMNTVRYDIEAKAEGSPTEKQMTGPMLQALMEDRFKLVFHRENRRLPVYALTVARTGLKMPASREGDCAMFSMNTSLPPFAKPGQLPFCGFHGFGVEGLSRTLDTLGVNMTDLASSLSMALHRTVIDKTGLSGVFDVHLKWIAEVPAGPESTPDLSAQEDGLSLFTALGQQLGLNLESAKGPVEVIVIDHLERPDAN